MDLLEEYNKIYQPFHDIIGAAYSSANWFKHGLHENVYEVGLKIELEEKGYIVHQQEEFPLYYKGRITPKKFRMDLVVESEQMGNIILELKALNAVDDSHRRQLCSYMRLTQTQYGMLINFSPTRVYSERFEYDITNNRFRKIK